MNTSVGPGPTSGHRKIALLRGINVGRSDRIAMADLRACTEAAGCSAVRTVLATGNVLLTDPRPEDEVRAVLEAAYAERFGYDAVVQVLIRDAVETAVAGYPAAKASGGRAHERHLTTRNLRTLRKILAVG